MRQRSDGEVHIAVCDQSDEVLSAVVKEVDLHVRVLLLEASDRLDHVQAARYGDGGNADGAAKQPLDLSHGIAGALGVSEGGACGLEERSAGVGELAPAA